ncbi:hypothetical protein J2Z81_001128 [Virgibacillus campisalis]|uniref:Uncharacterized protein n=1 Tax=Virgibacillus alimentarius TaxID=698769 RepID=A0ABS4S849_9BACI|nr:hypothetical protein [Virgibacillus alimentarius]
MRGQKRVKRYNGHRKLIDTAKGRTTSMNKDRKTIWKVRMDIVQDALAALALWNIELKPLRPCYYFRCLLDRGQFKFE